MSEYLVLTYEHWSSCAFAAICESPILRLPAGFNIWYESNSLDDAKKIAQEWLVESEERIGYCGQTEIKEITKNKTLFETGITPIEMWGRDCEGTEDLLYAD